MDRSNHKGMSSGSEEMVELMSYESIPNNQLGHENENFIIAEEVTSVPIDATTTNTIPNGTDDVTETLTDGLLHTTNHDSNELPEIARNLSWDDPFYESSNDRNDIIMAFDFDRQKYDQFLLPRVLGAIGIVLFLTVALQNGEVDPGFFIIILQIAFWAIFWSLMSDLDQRSKQLRVKRAHIDLTRHGIYFDEVYRPGGHNLMMRKLITYKEIRKCEVKREEGCNAVNYRVEVQLKARFSSNVVIEDILRSQLFVDIVNAFAAQYTDAATEENDPNNCTIS